MAEQRPGGEATEPPSERKLAKARERGEVARSRDVVSAAVVLGVCGTLALVWPQQVARLRELLVATLREAPRATLEPTALLLGALKQLAWLLAPLLGAALIAALLSSAMQSVPTFATQAVKPQLNRLNPLPRLKQLFGREALVQLAKSLALLGLLGWIVADVLWRSAPDLLRLTGATVETQLQTWAEVAGRMAWRASLVVVPLAIFDLVYQRRSYLRRMRMTKQEVKREHLESDGDPRHKAERQRLHREIVEQQAVERVAQADCVVINPVRIAVALRFDEKTMGAPQVIARGERLMAAKIREVARRHRIPIVRNVPLARALVELEIDQEIPRPLYEAVAEVLRFVYSLRKR